MSILALNVTPYITASIIMQLLTIAIPALEEMHKDGEEGRKKMNKITRYMTVALGILEGLGTSIGFGRLGYMDEYNAFNVALMVFCLLYVPCTATIATIHREVGSRKVTAAFIVFQLAVAWIVSFIIYHIIGAFL